VICCGRTLGGPGGRVRPGPGVALAEMELQRRRLARLPLDSGEDVPGASGPGRVHEATSRRGNKPEEICGFATRPRTAREGPVSGPPSSPDRFGRLRVHPGVLPGSMGH
jgi:hypothetical protein